MTARTKARPGRTTPSADPAPPAPNALRRGPVTRTMWPPKPGTQRWLRQFGAALVCVRHRSDPAGLRRYVTVELRVAELPVRAGLAQVQAAAWFAIELHPGESTLRDRLRQSGGRWDAAHRHWCARGAVVRALGLEDRVVFDRRTLRKGAGRAPVEP